MSHCQLESYVPANLRVSDGGTFPAALELAVGPSVTCHFRDPLAGLAAGAPLPYPPASDAHDGDVVCPCRLATAPKQLESTRDECELSDRDGARSIARDNRRQRQTEADLEPCGYQAACAIRGKGRMASKAEGSGRPTRRCLSIFLLQSLLPLCRAFLGPPAGQREFRGCRRRAGNVAAIATDRFHRRTPGLPSRATGLVARSSFLVNDFPL